MRLRTVIADGATRRSTGELLALPSERPLVRNFTARVMYAAVRLLTATSPPSPLLGEMQRSESTSFLFIAAGENQLEVALNTLFADTLGERATLWVAPGVTHTGAYSQYPQEYEQRVLAFFEDHLLRAEPDATDAEIESVSRPARMHDFIAGRPLGYNTLIGENGRLLSGGERQRLSLARAILKDALSGCWMRPPHISTPSRPVTTRTRWLS